MPFMLRTWVLSSAVHASLCLSNSSVRTRRSLGFVTPKTKTKRKAFCLIGFWIRLSVALGLLVPGWGVPLDGDPEHAALDTDPGVLHVHALP